MSVLLRGVGEWFSVYCRNIASFVPLAWIHIVQVSSVSLLSQKLGVVSSREALSGEHLFLGTNGVRALSSMVL